MNYDPWQTEREKAREIKYKGKTLARVILNETGKGYPSATVFLGNARKPSSNYYYRSTSDRFRSILRSVRNKKRWIDDTVRRRQERKEDIPEAKVGDIFYTSWGYDQTNVEFFQVVEVPTKRFVVVRELAQQSVSNPGGSSMSDYRMPVKDKFIEGFAFGSDPLRRMLQGSSSGSYIRICNVRNAWPWDGQKKYNSWYA